MKIATISMTMTLALAASLTINAQTTSRYRLGGNPAPAAAAPKTPANPAPAATPAAPTPQPEPALTEEKVQAMINEAVSQLPKSLTTDKVGGMINEAVSQLPKPEAPPTHDGWHYSLLVGELLLAAVVGFLLWVARPRRDEDDDALENLRAPQPGAGRPGAGTVAMLVGVLALSALIVPANAAGPTASCKTAAGEPAFFVNDGSVSDVVCQVSGVTAATGVTFADTNLTAANVAIAGNKLTFKLTVAVGATVPNEPDMSVNGTVVGHPIAVLDSNDAGKLDLTLRYLRGGGSASGATSDEGLFKSFLLGFGQACELKSQEIVNLLRSPQAGTSRKAAEMMLGCISGKIFSDDRFTAIKTRADAAQAQADAAKLTADAAQAKADTAGNGGVTEARATEIANIVVDGKISILAPNVAAAQATADEAKIAAGNATVIAKDTATTVVGVLKVAASGHPLPKATADAWARALCASTGVSCPPPPAASKKAKK